MPRWLTQARSSFQQQAERNQEHLQGWNFRMSSHVWIRTLTIRTANTGAYISQNAPVLSVRVKKVCSPGKRKRSSRQPCGDGLGGGVALTLGGLLCWRRAGEDGVEEVAEEGLLLESIWWMLGGGSYETHTHTHTSRLYQNPLTHAFLTALIFSLILMWLKMSM